MLTGENRRRPDFIQTLYLPEAHDADGNRREAARAGLGLPAHGSK